MRVDRHCFIALTMALVSAACGDNVADPDDSIDAGPEPAALDWQPCTFVVVTEELAEGLPDPECASLNVPLTNADPTGESIEVAVRRYIGSGEQRGQVWYLEGGPGGTGIGMETDLGMAALIERGWDFYIPIHRGLKGSTVLSCPTAEADDSPDGASLHESEFGSCAAELADQWGSSLGSFDADEQAHDLARLIEATNGTSDDVKVNVWGTSYGTFRALKFLEHYPEGQLADAVIVDAVLDLLSDPWNDSVYGDAAVLPVFVEACLADPMCAERTGSDPQALARRALATLDAGTCAPLSETSRQDIQYLITVLAELRIVHALVFPILDRLARCTATGAAEINQLLEVFAELLDPIASSKRLSVNGDHRDFLGPTLYANVSCRDLHRLEYTTVEILDRDENLIFSRDEAAFLNELCPDWPTYRDNPRPTTVVPTETPILIAQGVLDFPTPPQWARRAAQMYPSSQYVEIPAGGHGVFDLSGSANTPESGACMLELLDGFLNDPSATVDGTPCAALAETVDLSGNNELVADLVAALLGGNLWAAEDAN